MATLIANDGTVTEVYAKDTWFSLDEMYSLLECSRIEAVYLQDGRIMWIDEEGKFKPHQINIEATLLLQKAGGIPGDYIAGIALITEKNEVQ
ncbi:MAG: DUF3846 domain-containing protein [Desulfobulbaceae bacterium]|nr:DUF3846 domain-containing protein [Desulfobulbaceae bacterium]